MITYKDIKDWFEGTSYIYSTVNTSTEFDEVKNNVLKFLMNHEGSDLEATFTMHKIKLRKEMSGEVFVIEKNMPEQKSDTIRGRRLTRAECRILDDYRDNSADDINDIILPLLNIPPLTENQINHLVEATNNARLYY